MDRAVGLPHHEVSVGARLANIAPYMIPITACVTRSPAYTSPRSLLTAISTTKSQSVKIISATITPRRTLVQEPFHANYGRVQNRIP